MRCVESLQVIASLTLAGAIAGTSSLSDLV